MAERSRDWFRQAEADLRHARHAAEDEDFEWAAFAAQQAAEKALKGHPNGFDRGAPVDFYTAGEARQAITDAEAIVGFCGGQIG